MSPPLDSSTCQELADHIEKLTHTGQKTLDPEIVKKVKKICKSDERLVDRAFDLLLHQLKEKHSEVRLSAFQLTNELFRRSHRFRMQCCEQLRALLSLCTGTAGAAGAPEETLPPPTAAAVALRREALRAFAHWHRTYGSGYAELRLAHSFLTKCKKIDFDNLEFESSVERARAEEANRRQSERDARRLQQALGEFKDLQDEIQNTVISLENCIELLVPSLDNFFIPTQEDEDKLADEPFVPMEFKHKKENPEDEYSEEDEEEEMVEYAREHGMNSNFSVNLQLKPWCGVQETEDNTVVCESARDLHRLIQRKLLPSIKRCLSTASKCSGSAEDVRRMVSAKESLERMETRAAALGLKSEAPVGGDESSGEDDLEEVKEKEGYEVEPAPPPPVAAPISAPGPSVQRQAADWGLFAEGGHQQDPTCLLSTLSCLESSKEKNLTDKKGSSLEQSSFSKKGTDLAVRPSTSKGTFTKNKTSCTETLSSLKDMCVKNAPSSTKETTIIDRTSVKKVFSSTETPSTSQNSCSQEPESAGCSRKQRLLAVAPHLPFDVDLYHWEDEQLAPPTVLMVKPDAARFWSATPLDDLEEVRAPEGVAALRTRVIEFTGASAKGRSWACRARLPSGALCPRRDAIKCPFHGLIVARDATGRCQDPEDALREREAEEQKRIEQPDWQDPQLLKDIQEATGVDLKMPEKGKRKRKKEQPKYPGLTDIKAKQNNSYTRLAKKVFKQTTMKRVAQALDKADHKRFRDKFGDQFNYIHDTS